MMIQLLKRWTPFLVITAIIIVAMAYMFFNQQVVYYKPRTDDPAAIYREACQHCHGDKGQGTGLLYPGFDDEDLTLESVKKNIHEGSFLMPAFVDITGDTLQKLASYIFHHQYLDKYPAETDSATASE